MAFPRFSAHAGGSGSHIRDWGWYCSGSIVRGERGRHARRWGLASRSRRLILGLLPSLASRESIWPTEPTVIASCRWLFFLLVA